MRPRLPVVLLGLAVTAPPLSLTAQSVWLSPTPPPAIRIVRETARFGTSAAHLNNERNWVSTLRSKQVPYSYVGTVAASGAPQFWFIGGAADFRGLESLDASYQADKTLARQLDTLMAREAAFVVDVQTVLANYLPELSYRPVFIQPETRHFWVSTFTVRPGQDAAFITVLKAYAAAYAAAGSETSWVTYQLVAGGSSPTFYLLVPMTSYGDLDTDLAQGRTVGGKIPDPAAIAAQFTASTVQVETQVLTISPKISYVPDDFAEQDKAFWKAR